MLTSTLAFLISLFFAHTNHHYSGFNEGLVHPFSGLDHIVAMLAIGLWAGQMRGAAKWGLPLAFLSAMMVGGLVFMGSSAPFYTEHGIITSTVILGVFIAFAVRPNLVVSMVCAGLFGFFHGAAHGAECPLEASAITYGMGFLLSTAMLHAFGLWVAAGCQRLEKENWLRVAGALLCLISIIFIA